ncbi:MAG: PHP domain-containing protein [Acidobacteriota bacterium]
MIDLHTHTTASDGSLTPRELVMRAARQGVRALAVTDHDTLDGLAEAMAAGREFGVEIVPGLEISAEFSTGTMHILGYYIALDAPVLSSQLAQLRDARNQRNPRIVAKLQALGFDITLDEVEAKAGGVVIGRPHFARVMVEKGYVATAQEAFDRFLAKGAAAYVDKARLEPSAAIEAIRGAGGVAVLAHPYQLRTRDEAELNKIVASLKEAGLDGMEVIYSRHSATQIEQYQRLASHYELLITGGSDFHGITKPDIEVGVGLGELNIPAELLDGVKTRAAAHREHYCR